MDQSAKSNFAFTFDSIQKYQHIIIKATRTLLSLVGAKLRRLCISFFLEVQWSAVQGVYRSLGLASRIRLLFFFHSFVGSFSCQTECHVTQSIVDNPPSTSIDVRVCSAFVCLFILFRLGRKRKKREKAEALVSLLFLVVCWLCKFGLIMNVISSSSSWNDGCCRRAIPTFIQKMSTRCSHSSDNEGDDAIHN